MTRDEIKDVVYDALRRIAPEAEPQKIRMDADLREELDLDSMDFMNFVIALHEKLAIDIPEADYPKYFTLDRCVQEIERKTRESANELLLRAKSE